MFLWKRNSGPVKQPLVWAEEFQGFFYCHYLTVCAVQSAHFTLRHEAAAMLFNTAWSNTAIDSSDLLQLILS